MTPTQCEAASLLLKWSRMRLAAQINASENVVMEYEKRGHIPRPNGTGPIDRLAAIRAALEAAGIEFIDGDQPSVRLREKTRR